MPIQRVSQRAVAARANVHFTTVSLALRNSPTLPLATRERIQRIAGEMGYRPDPMLTALQAYRKNTRSLPTGSVIAWINSHKSAPELYRGNHTRLSREGAAQRCEVLGYRLEEFRLADVSPKRLHQILQVRNIKGLLLPPQARNSAHMNFPWQHYSAVAIGHTLSEPRLHRVVSAQYEAARVTMRHLWSYGYRRIGFVTTPNTDTRTNQNFTAAYLAAQQRFAHDAMLPVLFFNDTDNAANFASFRRWYEQHRPKAVMTFHPRVPEFLEQLGVSSEECGVALIHLAALSEQRDFAGIDQNDALIGASAVDLLVAMLHRNECGVPENPLSVLVEGRWVNGASIRRQMGKRQPAGVGESVA